MANYDTPTGVIGTVNDMVQAGTISAAVAAAISAAMVDLAPGVEPAATVTTPNVSDVQAAAIFAEGTAVQGTFAPNSPVQAVVVAEGTSGNNLTFTTSKDVSVVLGGGNNDNVQTAAGSDTVEFKGGSATINTGAGNDEIVVSADGNASVDGGDGFDRVTFHAAKSQHSFAFEGGKFVVHSGNIQMDNINVVTFDANADGVIENATVLASTAGESVVAKLYQIGLGRDILDAGRQPVSGETYADYQLAGFNWWTETGNAGNADANLMAIVQDFVGTTEFQAKIGSLGSAAAQVAQMFDNMGATGDVAGRSQADYAQALDSGQMSLADVALALATSTEATTIMGVNGEQYVIDGDFIFPSA